MRDFYTLDLMFTSSNSGFLNVIKYFPIAFLITDDPNFKPISNLSNLSKYSKLGIDDEADIVINLRTKKAYNFPEAVNETTVVFMSKESQAGIVGTPRAINPIKNSQKKRIN